MKTFLHAMVIYYSTISESSLRLLIKDPLSPYRLQLSLGVINDFRCSIVLSLITLCAPHLDAIITTSSVPPTVCKSRRLHSYVIDTQSGYPRFVRFEWFIYLYIVTQFSSRSRTSEAIMSVLSPFS